MKKKIVFALMIISVAIFAFTQERNEQRKPDAKMMLQHLSERLDLSQEQKDSIEPYLKEHIELMEVYRGDNKEDGNDSKQEFEIRTTKIEEKINSFLTEEQQKEYVKLKEERGQRRERPMKRK